MEPFRIAVVSDSHGLLRREVVQIVRTCDAVLHAGDITRETDLDELAVYAPIYAVRGNNDYAFWASRLKDVLRFELAGVGFVMTHERRNVPRDLSGVRAVICGHTHHYSEEWIDGRLWLNPGSCGFPRFGTEITMAMLELRGDQISARRIDLRNEP